MTDKTKKNDDHIWKIMSDPEKVRQIMQMGINDALRQHKLAGNPICAWRDGEIVWIPPEQILVDQSK